MTWRDGWTGLEGRMERQGRHVKAEAQLHIGSFEASASTVHSVRFDFSWEGVQTHARFSTFTIRFLGGVCIFMFPEHGPMARSARRSRGVLTLVTAVVAQTRFSFPSSANFDAQISQLAGQISQKIRLKLLTFPSYLSLSVRF